MGFAPFESRLCRDIRNCLSNSFLEALGENRMDPVHQTALAFLKVNRSAIPPIFKPDLLISALNNLESPPPKFLDNPLKKNEILIDKEKTKP